MSITAIMVKNKKPDSKFFFTASKLIDTAAPNFKLWRTINAGANQVKAAVIMQKIIRTKAPRNNEDMLFWRISTEGSPYWLANGRCIIALPPIINIAIMPRIIIPNDKAPTPSSAAKFFWNPLNNSPSSNFPVVLCFSHRAIIPPRNTGFRIPQIAQ